MRMILLRMWEIVGVRENGLSKEEFMKEMFA